MTDWTPMTARARAWFESLRDRICAEFEQIEAEAGSPARFEYLTWSREEEGNPDPGGGTRGVMKGRIFEKVASTSPPSTGSSPPNSPRRSTGRTRTTPALPPRASAWLPTWPIRTFLPCT